MTKGTDTKRIEITDYTDYQPYLTDLVRFKRQEGTFSFRIFCRKSGFGSPTYLKWVMDGVRPISPRSAHKFASGLSLDKQETHYFTLMVNYKETIDLQTKRSYYEQMLVWRQRRAGPLTKDAYEYLSHWYYVAIRELVALSDFKDDPRWIREKLGDNLTLWEIKNGFETLVRLKLICRNAKGNWQQTTRNLLTEYEVRSLAAYNYHTEILELAQKVLKTESSKVRDYQSMVALIDMETLGELKTKIQGFQKSIVDYLQERERMNGNKRILKELYALNMQLLPLVTNKREGL